MSDELEQRIVDLYPKLFRGDARRLLAKALDSRLVQNEILDQVDFLHTGQLPDGRCAIGG